MARFANRGPELGGEAGWPPLFWLAGLLEGEGSFLKPIPSDPGRPILSCRMTDLDVVELVAAAFGTRVQANDKGQHRTEFAALLRGARAVELMSVLRPMMSRRRQEAIDRALCGYMYPTRKLNLLEAEMIRRRRAAGQTISSLARRYEVSRPTIRSVLKGQYRIRRGFPWLPLSLLIRGATAAGTGLTWKELYWLAGWLEAEGSFCGPPPSSPRQARVHAGSSDKDVIEEVARLLRIKPQLEPSRAPNRSPYWRVLIRGSRAILLMQSIRPVMGKRRTDQIDAAISGAQRGMEPVGFEPTSSGTNDRCLQA
jgi:hypothetical protein